jgi:PAS domain S-box-containing protein
MSLNFGQQIPSEGAQSPFIFHGGHLESLGFATLFVDLRRRVVALSVAAAEMLCIGHKAMEMELGALRDLVYTEADRIAFARAFDEIYRRGGEIDLDLPIGGPNDSQRWLSVHLFAEDTANGGHLAIGVLQDVTDQKSLQLELQRKTAALERALEVARLGTYRIDYDRRMIELSPEMCEMFAAGSGPLIMPLDEYRSRFYFPEDHDPKVGQAEAAYQLRSPLFLESRTRRGDGQTIWVRARSTMEDQPDGGRMIFGVVQEVTDLVTARRELENKANEFRLLAENASDVVFQSDVARNLVWLSPSVQQFVGRSSEELIGSPASLLVAEQDRPTLEHFRDIAIGEGRSVELKVRLLRADGSERWVELRARAIYDEEGRHLGIVGGVRDCHEEVMLGRAVQTLSAGSLALVRAASEAELLHDVCTVAVDHGGYRASWYARTFGGTAHEITTIATSEGAQPIIEEILRTWGENEEDGPTYRALRTGVTQVAGEVIEDADHPSARQTAAILGVRSSLSLPVFVDESLDGVLTVYASEANGFDDRALATLQDLASEVGWGLSRLREQVRLDEAKQERDRAASQLEQMARLESIGQLAGGIAHDFNNLLTVQMSYCTLLESEINEARGGAVDWGRMQGHVEKVVLATEKAAELTNQLLTFARAKNAQAASASINSVVTETEFLLRRVLPAAVVLTTELAASLPTVTADPGQISQVLMNLVINASDAMPDGGAISIVTDLVHRDTADAPSVRLRVIDNGSGMPREVRERAFEPFYSTKGPDRGTGLGLATVYGIVTQAGGEIAIDSEIDVGTTIEILLPPAYAQIAARMSEMSTPTQPRPRE